MQGRANLASECARAGNEIGVNVGFRDVRDPQAVPLRGQLIFVEIEPRIHDDRFPRLFTRYQPARLGETFVVEAFEYHRRECSLESAFDVS
jgi:hypothetical protein